MLAPLVESGELGELASEDGQTVLRAAQQVGLSAMEAQEALRTAPLTLVAEVRARIRDGSRRLMHSMSAADRLLAEGDPEAARRVMDAVLEVEPVDFYRRIALAHLRGLGL